MKTLEIHSSHPYKVRIGSGLLSDAGKFIRECGNYGKAAVVCDDVTFALFGSALKESLETYGIPSCFFSFPHGETSKNINTLQEIYSFLVREEITRGDFLIALGGGVVGDITGFAAATYLRGVDCVQIPTTLISQTDSSVGGKTAVNLPEGKNLCGCFHSPKLVLCDTDTIQEPFLIREGIAEVIKYGLLADPELFSLLESADVKEHLEEIVTRSISIKAQIVERDEWDLGERQLLNLGHTLGHGVEKLSGFTVPHGIAVGIGISMVLSACVANGLLDKAVLERLYKMFRRFELPVAYENARLEEIAKVAFSDKKRFGGDINLIVCTEIGRCSIKKMPIGELEPFIRRGWSGR